mmetsp:Transcript_19051/g.32528  ORF Transcript_19051/g.32528 Transcript_19051/m.32528 type:complete len:158 (-) Transcript_19051:332-805(-)
MKEDFEEYRQAECIPVVKQPTPVVGFQLDQEQQEQQLEKELRQKTTQGTDTQSIQQLIDRKLMQFSLENQRQVSPQDFKPISTLGKGSFGEVYLVEKGQGELFAMKVLNKEKIMANNYIKYAMTEINVLQYTQHPFIVSLNYVFQTDKKLYLILDYC